MPGSRDMFAKRLKPVSHLLPVLQFPSRHIKVSLKRTAGFEQNDWRSSLAASVSKAEHVRTLLQTAGEDGPKGPYRAYFYFFNRQQFYEAHDILESLWLAELKGARNNFYKALIQLAGAFVHLQKHRVQPAIALFKLSRSYLENYPPMHEGLDLARVLEMIDGWLARLETLHPSPEIRFELRGVSLKLGPCD